MALNSVSHEVLFSKLKLHRVAGIVLNWLGSYLHDRRQRVTLDFTSTHCFQLDGELIKRGVPQGSVLEQCCSIHMY